jgi:hypothetical protein
MTVHPPSTVKVTKIRPCGDTEVCITMELVVDVHRLAEVGSELLKAVTDKLNTGGRSRKS